VQAPSSELHDITVSPDCGQLVYASTSSCSPKGKVSLMAGSRGTDKNRYGMFRFGVVASKW